ncbi:MAG: hypothetical protein EBR82_41210, partial [Caulobacteraceae bacterium]|nr:hypothetical protein [Caulobacteraceae bacterium]
MSAPTPTDFPAPDALYTQEPAGLFMGVEPAMALCALLVLIAVAVLAYYVGAKRFSSRGGSNATTDAIHARILKASQAALAADSNHLKQRSEDLVNLIDKLLGPVIKLGAGVGGPLKLLEQALKGEVDVPAPAAGDHGHGPGQGSHDAHRSEPAAAAAAAGGGGGGA